jgi:hypothetical protein
MKRISTQQHSRLGSNFEIDNVYKVDRLTSIAQDGCPMANIADHQIQSQSAVGRRIVFVRTGWPTVAAYAAFLMSFLFTAAFVFGAF